MKVEVTETRTTKFFEPPGAEPFYRIDITYDVYLGSGMKKTLYSKESLEAYLKYLQERKNDYEKVIKEIEI